MMGRRLASCLVVAATAAAFVSLAGLETDAARIATQVMVRAVSKDAMVIGSKVGGARITVREVDTGVILAQGIQEGTSGNVGLIMSQPRIRGVNVFDTPGTAGFLASLMLDKPTVVEITAEGPLGSPESLQRASKTLLLVPGQDVLEDGVILEIHGFTVRLLSPEPKVQPAAGSGLPVRATVHML